MNSEAPKRTIIYCRVSSVEQVDRTSLETQERACRDYAKKEGLEVIEPVFIEKGESAKTADRTEFKKAISFCSSKKNKVDIFLVYKVDRFSRNAEDYTAIKAALRHYGVEVRSATEPIDESPLGKLMGGVLSHVAEFDNDIRTERTRNGMLERLAEGVWVWPAPIGYLRQLEGSNITPDPERAEYLRMAFQEYAKGIYTYKSLAKHLHERGFKTRTGKAPSAQLIEKILKNPIYYGVMEGLGQTFKGSFEPVISEELFFQCQGRKRKGHHGPRNSSNPSFPLRRFCICAVCQTPLTGGDTVKKNRRYPYYHHQKQECVKAKYIPKASFEQMFVEFLDSLNPSNQFETMFKAIVADVWQRNYKKLDEVNAKTRRVIEVLERERQKVFDLHISGKYSDDEFLEQKNRINKDIGHQKQLLQDRHVEEFDMEEALNYCFTFVRETSKTWQRLQKVDHGQLIRFQNLVFPQKVTFDGEKFGTAELALVYRLGQQTDGQKSKLVALRGIEPRF